jgi:hypothetical protein
MHSTQRITMAVLAFLFFLSAIARASATSEVDLASWKVTVGGKTSAVVTPSGEQSRMEAEGKTFALVPEVKDPAAGEVLFRVFEITKVDAVNERLQQREMFTLRPGASYSTAWQPRLTVVLNGVSKAEDTSTQPAPATTLVAWVVRVPSPGKDIKLVGKDGEMTRIERPGLTLGIRPRVQDSQVNFEVYEILQGEVLKEIGNYTLPNGGEVKSRNPSFFLKLTQIAAAGHR